MACAFVGISNVFLKGNPESRRDRVVEGRRASSLEPCVGRGKAGVVDRVTTDTVLISCIPLSQLRFSKTIP